MKTPRRPGSKTTAQYTLRLCRPPGAALFDAITDWVHGTAAALRAAWQRRRYDPRTAYLSCAMDHADLERRMQAWDRQQAAAVNWPPTLT